jgi:hypothetical protein
VVVVVVVAVAAVVRATILLVDSGRGPQSKVVPPQAAPRRVVHVLAFTGDVILHGVTVSRIALHWFGETSAKYIDIVPNERTAWSSILAHAAHPSHARSSRMLASTLGQ